MRRNVPLEIMCVRFLCFAVLCLVCSVVYPRCTALARDTTTVPLKKWSEYTRQEKQALENRWAEAKVEEVVEALRKGRRGRMPDYVPLLPSEESPPGYGYDLRGITLWLSELDSVSLQSAWLQGADLSGTSLQGANLVRTSLQDAILVEANMEGARLWRANLQGADLSFANLKGANIREANLQGADLSFAILAGAYLNDANIEGAYLEDANLQGADIWRAKLQGANLRGAGLQGADLRYADLADAELFGAVFDSTYLTGANLGSAKNIRFAIWGDKVKRRYIIGEEVKIGSLNQAIDSVKGVIHSLQVAADSLRTMKDRPAMTIDSLERRIKFAVRDRDLIVRSRPDAFLRAELTYRDLKTFYRKELLDDVAMEFHFRENEVRTKASPQYVRPLRVLFLKWTYGYGSRPSWLVWYSLVVVGLFSLIFTLLTMPRKTESGIYLTRPGSDQEDELLPFRKGRLFLDCFYFSLLSFATFGYGAIKPQQWLQLFRLEPVEYRPVRWARIFVGIEAALGIWVFALLVTVLFGK